MKKCIFITIRANYSRYSGEKQKVGGQLAAQVNLFHLRIVEQVVRFFLKHQVTIFTNVQLPQTPFFLDIKRSVSIFL